MISDLDLALREMETLNELADQGIIDRERWLVFIEFLELADCPLAAKSMRLSLKVYESEWKKLQEPAMAESEAE